MMQNLETVEITVLYFLSLWMFWGLWNAFRLRAKGSPMRTQLDSMKAEWRREMSRERRALAEAFRDVERGHEEL